MKTGIYCGSFSPVHKGHLTLINTVLSEKIVDRVIVVATGDYWDKEVAIELKTRIACLKVYENEKIVIDENPAHCHASSTYELMGLLQKEYPNDSLMLMVGADNLLHFEKWINSAYLLEHYPFIVMKRDGIEIETQMKRLNKKDYWILGCERVDISSSLLLKQMKENQSVKDWMDKPVAEIISDYLKKNG